jgi:hypothetical protein
MRGCGRAHVPRIRVFRATDQGVDGRDTSAVTRVHSASKTRVNALIDADMPGHDVQ